jgi:ribosome-binding protein aMBF1 (putative translation factor)
MPQSDADWLRAAIAKLGTSQTALAKALQVDARLVRRWASGQEKLPHIARLAVERLMIGSQLKIDS